MPCVLDGSLGDSFSYLVTAQAIVKSGKQFQGPDIYDGCRTIETNDLVCFSFISINIIVLLFVFFITHINGRLASHT